MQTIVLLTSQKCPCQKYNGTKKVQWYMVLVETIFVSPVYFAKRSAANLSPPSRRSHLFCFLGTVSWLWCGGACCFVRCYLLSVMLDNTSFLKNRHIAHQPDSGPRSYNKIFPFTPPPPPGCLCLIKLLCDNFPSVNIYIIVLFF